MEFKLNEMQGVASEMFQEWFLHPEKRTRPWFEISGAAGTGKTTVVKHIIATLGLTDSEVIFMAFVGKAALALRRSGVNGRTVHSVIYRVARHYKRNADGVPIMEHGIPVIETSFEKLDELPANVKLLVVDEGGMISRNMAEDILSFQIPTLVLGDTNQLPPVIGGGFFLINPDVVLNEIMRQSKDSPIIVISQLAIHGVPISYGQYQSSESGDDSSVRIMRLADLTDDDLRQFDVVLCPTNESRDQINWYYRSRIRGIDSRIVTVGDRLICRQNCWGTTLNDSSVGVDIALVNGLDGYVTGVNKNPKKGSKGLMSIDFRPSFSDHSFKDIPINPTAILGPCMATRDKNPKFQGYVSFELGDCVTCHLAQGSQYPSVLVLPGSTACSNSDFSRRWLYTAITRAQKHLTIAL
jgi:exodeoxyribonuclease-5